MAAATVTPNCGAIILAAGQSRRMGSNKLIAELNGRRVITYVADAIDKAGLPPPIVVLGHDPEPVRAALGDHAVRFVTANDHAEGMARSLAAGIMAVPLDWDAVIICLGDMPLVAPALLRSLSAQAHHAAILVPTYEGRRGNPVLWGRDYFGELAGLRGDIGARTLLERHADAVTLIPWADACIHLDADTPQDLALVRAALPVTGGNTP